jgi:hypothetical protein
MQSQVGSGLGATVRIAPLDSAGQESRPPRPASSGPRRPDLRHRVDRVDARGRLEDELRAIAVDLLGPNEADEFPVDCAGWVARTTDAAVSVACAAALDTLIDALESGLGTVPPVVARRLRDARARQDAGFA